MLLYFFIHYNEDVLGKAVTRRMFWVFEHPPKFQGKIRHTKTDLLLLVTIDKD